MADLEAIKARQSDVQIGTKTYPKVNALGAKDQKDIRALISEVERLTAENNVMREYIHDCGLSDDDIKLWVEAFPVSVSGTIKYYIGKYIGKQE